MGLCMSAEQREKAARDKAIEKHVQAGDEIARKTVKLLLLGAGESGKSTFVKQMKIIHGDGYTQEELQGYKPTIVDNLVQSMGAVLEGMGNMRINLGDQSKRKQVRLVVETMHSDGGQGGVLTPDICAAVKDLITDPGVKEALEKQNKFQLNDSAEYFFDRVDEIAKPDYCPSQEDVIKARVQTTGIIETQFQFKDMIFNVIDVGGQRSERKKWIQAFDDVTAVLFCAALSGYDTLLREDDSTNRLLESLELFDGICNNVFFRETEIILFLNKTDLFAKKIKTSRLTDYFSAYTGPEGEEEPARQFILKMFEGKNTNKNRKVYHHFTCATDTEKVNAVFESVSNIIIENRLSQIGFGK